MKPPIWKKIEQETPSYIRICLFSVRPRPLLFNRQIIRPCHTPSMLRKPAFHPLQRIAAPLQ